MTYIYSLWIGLIIVFSLLLAGGDAHERPPPKVLTEYPTPITLSPTPTPSPAPTESPTEIPEVPAISQPVEIIAETTPQSVPQPAPVITNDIEALVCSFDWDCLRALHIMWCESGGRPDAVSGAGYYGLFQISPMHAGPEFWNNWMIPEYNIALAHGLYTSGGWWHWPVCQYY